MTTKDILDLKYNDKNGKSAIDKCLQKIKPFENKEVTMEMLEKYVGLVVRKYDVVVSMIFPFNQIGEDNIYSAHIRNCSEHRILEQIYGNTYYELYAKISIYFYSLVKNGLSVRKTK